MLNPWTFKMTGRRISRKHLRRWNRSTASQATEVLEDRTLLAASLIGIAFEDTNGDGEFQELGQPGVTVYLDQNDNGVLDQIGNSGVEPDDFNNGEVLTNVNPAVTLSTLDGNGNVIGGAPVIAVGGATNPDKIIGHSSNFGAEDVLWEENFRSLRMDFSSPVAQVSIDYISRGLGDRGRLEVYDSTGQLLETVLSDQFMNPDQRDTMTSTIGNISFVIATGFDDGNPQINNGSGFLDRLSFIGATEEFRVTDADGVYRFDDLEPGEYIVRQVVPDGFRQTAPNESRLFAVRPANNQIVELDPTNGSTLNSFAIPGTTFTTNGLAFDGNSLFFIDANADTLFELDPDTGAVRDSLFLDPQVFGSARWDGVAAIGGLVYVNTASGRILAFDPDTNTLESEIQFEQGSNFAPFGALGEVVFQGQAVLAGSIGSSSQIVLLDPEDEFHEFGDQLAVIPHGFVSGAADLGLAGIGANLFVGFNDASGTVQVLSTTGQITNQFQTGFAVSGLAGGRTAVDAYRVSVADGETVGGLFFGNQRIPSATLRGTAFIDDNGDGIQGPGENPLPNSVVFLDQNNNGLLDADEQSTQTGSDGGYEFINLDAGEYIIRQLPPVHYEQTSPTATGNYYSFMYVINGNGAMQIGTIDPITGEVARYGTPITDAQERMHGLIRTNDGRFFGLNGFGTDSLFEVDLLTNEVTEVGPISVNGINRNAAFGLTYDPANDVIYALVRDPVDGRLKLGEIDRTDGSATLKGPGTNELTRTSGLAFDTNRNTIVAFDNDRDGGLSNQQFWEFDLDGNVTLLWEPAMFDGWGFTFNGDEFLLHARRQTDGDPALFNRLFWRIDPYAQTVEEEFFIAESATPMESLEYFEVQGGHLVLLTETEVREGLNFGNAFVNEAPIAAPDFATVDEDNAVTIDVLDNDFDAEGDTLTVAFVLNGPANGTAIVNPDNTITYTPNADFNGSDTFSYRVIDNFGGADTGTVTITIDPVNDAPLAEDDAYTTNEDVALVVATPGVLGNDADIEGDALTSVLVDGPANGTLSLSADGSFTYTPNPDFNGSDSFTYKTSDGDLESNTATVNITVLAVNDAPVANEESFLTNEDTPIVITAPGVLANDTDVDGDGLTAVLMDGPANGTLSLNANGSFTYTPNANFNGSDSFTYKANDGNLDSNTVTVDIGVIPVNDAPTAQGDVYSTLEDTPLVIAAPGVLANDTDVDGDALTATLVSGPANGTLSLNADGSLTYTPDANFNGSDSFTYLANDGILDSNVATVSINILAVNDAPVAQGDDYTTSEDTPLVIAAPGVLANDTDVDGDALTAALVDGPENGTLSLNADGSFTYTPNANFSGSDSFTYKTNDGELDSNTATVNITVVAVNDAPVANEESFLTNEDAPLVIAAPGVLANDTDMDGDVLTAVLVGDPANGTLSLNPDGSFTYTPNANFNGSDSFTYKANDGDLDSNTVTVDIGVIPVNDDPVAEGDVASTDENVAVTIDVLANDSDVDLDSLTVSQVTDGANGTVTINADQTVTYTPNPGS